VSRSDLIGIEGAEKIALDRNTLGICIAFFLILHGPGPSPLALNPVTFGSCQPCQYLASLLCFCHLQGSSRNAFLFDAARIWPQSDP
jgi:hypothetical protein